MSLKRAMLSMVIGAAMLFVGAGAVSADVYSKTVTVTDAFEMQGQVMPASADTAVSWMTDGMAAMQAGNSRIILRADEGKFYMVDDDQKAYVEMPSDVFGAMLEEVTEEDAAMADSVRDMMERMGQDIGVTIQKTDETKKIREWNATKYDIVMTLPMGKIEMENWITQDVEFDWNLMRALNMGSLAMFPGIESVFDEIAKLEGVTVTNISTMVMMGTPVTSTTEMIEYEGDREAPEGIYEIPEEYTKKDRQSMMGGMGGR